MNTGHTFRIDRRWLAAVLAAVALTVSLVTYNQASEIESHASLNGQPLAGPSVGSGGGSGGG